MPGQHRFLPDSIPLNECWKKNEGSMHTLKDNSIFPNGCVKAEEVGSKKTRFCISQSQHSYWSDWTLWLDKTSWVIPLVQSKCYFVITAHPYKAEWLKVVLSLSLVKPSSFSAWGGEGFEFGGGVWRSKERTTERSRWYIRYPQSTKQRRTQGVVKILAWYIQ